MPRSITNLKKEWKLSVKKLFLLMATLLVIAPSSFTQGSATSKIAFTSYRDGNAEIYLMNIDGSAQTRLTDHPGRDFNPAWSPDGARIAFTSDRDGNAEIYVMNADGSGITRLTHDPASDGGPEWSPDGSRLAFASDRDGNWEIYVMNADGSGVTRLTNHPAFDGEPTWSPDGRKIAFVSARVDVEELGPFTGICVMNADGSELTQLTGSGDFLNAPRWSPDGSKILFRAGAYLLVMSPDGSGGRVLKFVPGVLNPAWSPDGRQIVFERFDPDNRIPNSEIYTMNADGSDVTRLTNNPAYDYDPSWSR
jgi:Tol biopolymer transport system component